VLFIPTFAGPHLDVRRRGRDRPATATADARACAPRWWFLVGVETLTVRGNVIDLPEPK
jgi:hypothetical protein